MKKAILSSLFAIAILFSFAFIPATDIAIENDVATTTIENCEAEALVACTGDAKGASRCSNPNDDGYYFFSSTGYQSPIFVADGSTNSNIFLPTGNYVVYFIANKCKMSAKWSFCGGAVTGNAQNILVYPGPPVPVAVFAIP